MCGITGFFDSSQQMSADMMQEIARRMSDTLLHRGPDDGGSWVDGSVGIALGHRRLAIVDLSPEGRQPMVSADGRYVIVFNGEVYNFLELRHELELLGHCFRGHSDTEVMLASLSSVGTGCSAPALQWHVCLCPMGSSKADFTFGARSLR
jgi:asparagine synthase (glutamine-hydrolysing)